MMQVLTAIAAASLAASAAAAQEENPLRAEGKQLYATAETGSEFCPNLEMKFGVRAVISRTTGFDPYESDATRAEYREERDRLFGIYRRVNNRAAVCELLANQYGPGSEAFEMFAFK